MPGVLTADTWIDPTTGDPHKFVQVVYSPNSALILHSNGDPVLDKFAQSTTTHTARLYFEDVPGGPSWPPARIEEGKRMMQNQLPQGLWIVDVNDDPGRAHISFAISTTPP